LFQQFLPIFLIFIFRKNNAANIILVLLAQVTNFVDFQIKEYILQDEKDVPLVILGESGSGKTSLMCKAAETVLAEAVNSELPRSVL
jgi:ABC-type taurine transport system ATPase subunit